MVHWKTCGKFNLEKSEKWYLPNPQTVTENVKPQTNIVIVNKMEKTAMIIDVAIPEDKRLIDKEKEDIEKHHNLKREIQRLWNLKKIDVIPVVLGALGRVTENFEKYAGKD